MKTFNEWLISESKANIENIGYPALIAKLFYKKYDKNAFLIAKWYRSYYSQFDDSNRYGTGWFEAAHRDWTKTNINDLLLLHNATKSKEDYIAAAKHVDISLDDEEKDEIDDYYLQEQKQSLSDQIEREFFEKTFFNNKNFSIVQDVASGSLKDVAPYKNLSIWDAQKKYDTKKVFSEKTPIKEYKDGFKWIDVGSNCFLVGTLMKNCGSTGVMGRDPNRTMIALFSRENKPHVVVTYHPSENRISGDEGIGSSPVKTKYHKYVIDLAHELNARFDVDKTKSKDLGVKYSLHGVGTGLRKLSNDTFGKTYNFNVGDESFYTDGYTVVSKEDVEKMKQALQNKTLTLNNVQRSPIKMIFSDRNQPILKDFGINYIPLKNFKDTHKEVK
jgi:hypothetical protein